jgi:hypothetical protein
MSTGWRNCVLVGLVAALANACAADDGRNESSATNCVCGSGYTCSGGECVADDDRPPAGAAMFEITPLPGGGCRTSPPLFTPTTALQYLTCDPAITSCDPTKEVVFDGDGDARVACRVCPSGSGYTVSFSLKSEILELSGNSSAGGISMSGGTLSIYSYSAASGTSQQSPACELTVQAIEPGSIWASFDCPTYGEASSAAGLRCTAQGVFAFLNCDE